MDDYTGRIVESTAGHDKGGLFFVIGMEAGILLLADGKRRKLTRPKKKKPGHVRLLDDQGFKYPALDRLREGSPLSDQALRKALATFKGGNHTWQKTI